MDLTAGSRVLFPAALSASLALHALALLLPSAWLIPSRSLRDESVAVLTARLEPRPATDSAPTEVLKNTLEPSPERVRPKVARENRKPPHDAANPQQKRQLTARVEQLSEEQLSKTLARLSKTLLYPPEALRRGLEGEVVLLLQLDDGGRIVDASVAASSGHPILDDAALRAALRLGGLGESSAGKAILLPVRFKLL